MPVLAPYKLVSREFRKEDSVIDLGKGGENRRPGIGDYCRALRGGELLQPL